MGKSSWSFCKEGDLATPEEFGILSAETRMVVRDAFLDNTKLIDSFVEENPGEFGDEELEIIESWHHLVAGKFFLFRQLKKYMVFLDSDEAPTAFGVVALTETFEDLVGPYLPVMAEAVLLPFKGKIIYDGFLNAYNLSFGGGIRGSLNDSYREAKERVGIVTCLPPQPAVSLMTS